MFRDHAILWQTHTHTHIHNLSLSLSLSLSLCFLVWRLGCKRTSCNSPLNSEKRVASRGDHCQFLPISMASVNGWINKTTKGPNTRSRVVFYILYPRSTNSPHRGSSPPLTALQPLICWLHNGHFLATPTFKPTTMHHLRCIIKSFSTQDVALSVLLYGRTTWTLTKHNKKKDRSELHKTATSYLEQTLEQQLYGHLRPISKTIKVGRTRHVGHCWRTEKELISDVWELADQRELIYIFSVRK